jgi:hypothetical protein
LTGWSGIGGRDGRGMQHGRGRNVYRMLAGKAERQRHLLQIQAQI